MKINNDSADSAEGSATETKEVIGRMMNNEEDDDGTTTNTTLAAKGDNKEEDQVEIDNDKKGIANHGTSATTKWPQNAKQNDSVPIVSSSMTSTTASHDPNNNNHNSNARTDSAVAMSITSIANSRSTPMPLQQSTATTASHASAMEEILNDIAPLPPPPEEREPSRPGAYSADPTAAEPTRRSTFLFSLVGAFLPGLAEGVSGGFIEDTSHSEHTNSPFSTRSKHKNDNSTSDLVVADPVSSRFLDLAVAEAVEERESRKKEVRLRLGLCLCCATGFVLLVVVLLVVFLRDKKEEDATTATTAAPLPSPTTLDNALEGHILNLLPDYSLDALDVSSPQSQAYQWLLEDPFIGMYPDWRIQQRFVLAVLFHATNGPNWLNNTHWLDYDHHECEWFAQNLTHPLFGDEMSNYLSGLGWYQQPCDDDNDDDSGKVMRHIWLYYNGLEGTIPPELFFLTSLRSINVGLNKLSGNLKSLVPRDLSKPPMPLLEAIGLFHNQLEGQIPPEIGLFSNLKVWASFSNDLEGPIPTQISLLSNLEWFVTHNNQLTGTIPTEISNMSKLRWFALSGNSITGTIPTSLPTSMAALSLNTNQLTGTIPSELGIMRDLFSVNLKENRLTGTIPVELANASLIELQVPETMLSGTVPPQLCGIEVLTFDCHNDSTLLCGCDCECAV